MSSTLIATAAGKSSTTAVLAQVYTGGGISAGITAAQTGINGVTSGNLRDTIGKIIDTALSYAALLAVAVIVIAGFYLILGLGEETSKEKAKKIILYTAVGLVILLTAKAIVTFFISLPQ